MFKFSGIAEPSEVNDLIAHLCKVGTDLQLVEVKTAAWVGIGYRIFGIDVFAILRGDVSLLCRHDEELQ